MKNQITCEQVSEWADEVAKNQNAELGHEQAYKAGMLSSMLQMALTDTRYRKNLLKRITANETH